MIPVLLTIKCHTIKMSGVIESSVTDSCVQWGFVLLKSGLNVIGREVVHEQIQLWLGCVKNVAESFTLSKNQWSPCRTKCENNSSYFVSPSSHCSTWGLSGLLDCPVNLAASVSALSWMLATWTGSTDLNSLSCGESKCVHAEKMYLIYIKCNKYNACIIHVLNY